MPHPDTRFAAMPLLAHHISPLVEVPPLLVVDQTLQTASGRTGRGIGRTLLYTPVHSLRSDCAPCAPALTCLRIMSANARTPPSGSRSRMPSMMRWYAICRQYRRGAAARRWVCRGEAGPVGGCKRARVGQASCQCADTCGPCAGRRHEAGSYSAVEEQGGTIPCSVVCVCGISCTVHVEYPMY